MLRRLEVQADAMASWVQKKANQPWRGIAAAATICCPSTSLLL
jgi:hypothetical protein